MTNVVTDYLVTAAARLAMQMIHSVKNEVTTQVLSYLIVLVGLIKSRTHTNRQFKTLTHVLVTCEAAAAPVSAERQTVLDAGLDAAVQRLVKLEPFRKSQTGSTTN